MVGRRKKERKERKKERKKAAVYWKSPSIRPTALLSWLETGATGF